MSATDDLFSAVQNDYTKPADIKPLLKFGAKVNVQDKYGTSTLAHAAKHLDVESVKLLIEAGADIHHKDNDGGTMLDYAARNQWGDDIVQLFIDAGLDVNSRSNKFVKNSTPLISAMFSYASLRTVYRLIYAGADVNARAEYDRTVLMYAAGDVSSTDGGIIVDVLIENGADVNAVDAGGNTALIHVAARNLRERVIEQLVKAGADINHKNDIELTALMQAVSFNPNPAVIQTLVRLGADVFARSNTGATALDYVDGYSGDGKRRVMNDEQRNAQVRKILIDAVK